MKSAGFADWANPTDDELRRWASDPDAVWPEQDWNIIVARPEQGGLYIELASDVRCPARGFFLDCLYVLAGDAVRTKFRAHNETSIRDLVAKARMNGDVVVVDWANRAEELISNPSIFSYAAWCDGALAHASIATQDQT